jgi:hypothetical protein
MSVGFALLLFAGAAASDQVAAVTVKAPTQAETAPITFDNYTQAYQAAKASKRPMIVILNPGRDTQVSLISLEDVQRTRGRRELLQHYVVAVVDTSTSHGKKVYQLFGSPQLPHISVIDNQQAMQVYQTSQSLYGQMWDQILTAFQNAGPATRLPAPQSTCPYCQQYQR